MIKAKKASFKEIPDNLEQLMQPGWRALAKIIVQSIIDDDRKEVQNVSAHKTPTENCGQD